MQEENKSTIEELEKRISELEEQKTEMENNWKRALADYRNLVKRTEEERLEFSGFNTALTVKRLLPILDNLEMLEKHLDDIGLKMIVKEFRNYFKEEGLEEINSLGEKFDATKMEAVEMVDGKKDIVVEILNKGYLLKGKLIRPTRVKVGNGKE